MMDALSSPLALVVEILFILAVWLLYLGLVTGVRPTRTIDRLQAWFVPWLEREEAQAAALGLSPHGWMALRGVGVAGGLGVGIWAGTPLTILGGLVLGLVGLPYLLASRAERRRLAMDQALVEMVRTVAALVRGSNQTLDQALTDQGQNPHPSLREALAPLSDTHRSLRERLIEVDRRIPGPIANRVCLDLLIALHITPESFLEAAEKVLIPQYEQDLQIQRRNHAIAAGSRQSAFMVVLLMAVMFLFVMGNQSLRRPYESLAGQLVIVLISALVGGILWLIHALTPRARWVRWDLAKMSQLLGRRYG
jgi:hypothetical protein